MQPARILFIDAYDSFSNSVIDLLRAELLASVESIKIDDPRFVLNDETFSSYLHGFDAVVAGPGPGHPANPEDVGLIGKLWHLPNQHPVPALGICLGFQSLCLAFGASIKRLLEPRHGISASITHCGKDIYSKTGDVVATQYHSLHAELKDGLCNGTGSALRQCTKDGTTLAPLAWDLGSDVNGPTLMSVRHVSLPFWGVQYHPESICTNKEGHKIIANWWKAACDWNINRSNKINIRLSGGFDPQHPAVRSSLSSNHDPNHRKASTTQSPRVQWKCFSIESDFRVSRFVSNIRERSRVEPLLLESGTRNGLPVNAETGRFTIIGFPDPSSSHIRYYTEDQVFEVAKSGEVHSREHLPIDCAFKRLDQLVRLKRAIQGPIDSPFWGGMIGFVSYEAGLDSIGVAPSPTKALRPDMWFVFVERSVVIDHTQGIAYVQSIAGEDQDWIESVRHRLHHSKENSNAAKRASDICRNSIFKQPRESDYRAKIDACQANLRAGESYELCLTDQTTVQSSVDAWSLYCHVRSHNPAPFSSYLHFHDIETPSISVVSSSPERFVSWSRSGKCQFRPIKGTVKKYPRTTRAEAEEILNNAKERAENLMIVDLIRHDLSGVPGVSNVCVPQLMSIEEYETVFQLVSVIEGDLSPSTSGIAALAASLPPGSMTGAPKKRSCEILKEIENEEPRGLYSGVIGYLDVGGGGDFSVVIRTAFRWNEEDWRIGAGGAITVLSETKSEWEEMLTKRESVLRSFQQSDC